MHKANQSSFKQRKPLVLAIAFAMALSTNAATAQDDQDDDLRFAPPGYK